MVTSLVEGNTAWYVLRYDLSGKSDALRRFSDRPFIFAAGENDRRHVQIDPFLRLHYRSIYGILVAGRD